MILTSINRKAAVQFVIVLAAATALKQYYSTATVNGLRWILWPTTRLTELLTGTHFAFESNAGYVSSDRSFLIAGVCSGVNFLIAAFAMLALRKIWKERRTGARWFSLAAAAGTAYAVTIVANSIRISSALWMNGMRQKKLFGMDYEEVHRLDGILIYFGFLLLLYVMMEKPGNALKSIRFRRYLFPLFVYYAMTLAVPLLNGAWRQGLDFWQHAGYVFATPIVLIIAASIPLELFSRYAQRKKIAAVLPAVPIDRSADQIRTRANVCDAAALSHRLIWLKGRSIVTDR
jgi:exosortase K